MKDKKSLLCSKEFVNFTINNFDRLLTDEVIIKIKFLGKEFSFEIFPHKNLHSGMHVEAKNTQSAISCDEQSMSGS